MTIRDELDALLADSACENECCESTDQEMYVAALVPAGDSLDEYILCLPCFQLAVMQAKKHPTLREDN